MKSTFKQFINRSAVAAVVSGMLAMPVFAHHSASGYDLKKTEAAMATIKEFRWGAPHSSGVFLVKGAKGEVVDLPVSSANPSIFIRNGFNPKDFKVGEKVAITWHPTRSGKPGGILSSIKFADGREFVDQEFVKQVQAVEAEDSAKVKDVP